jgi:hypothetical protein
VVEIAPAIVLESADTLLLRQTLLRTYDFDWQVLAKTRDLTTAIAGGYGGMYTSRRPRHTALPCRSACHVPDIHGCA